MYTNTVYFGCPGTRGGGCLQQHSANIDAIEHCGSSDDTDTLPAETLGIEAPHSPPKQARSECDGGKDSEEKTDAATAEPINLPILGACDPPRTGPIASTPEKGCNEVPEPSGLDLSGLSINEPMVTGEYEELIRENREADFVGISFSEILRERFNAFARDFNGDFSPAPPGIDEIKWLRGALEEIHRVILDKCEEDEDYYIGVKMSSDTFVHAQAALKLHEAAGVNVTDAGCGMDHLDIFQEYFYRESTVIVVYSKGTVGDGVGPIYDGRILFEALGKKWTNRANLSFDENEKHFDLILDLYGVRNHKDTRRYYCERCNLGFCEPFRHRNCPEFCDSCHARPECKSDGNSISCRDCRREFVNQQCFERHRSVGSYSFRQSNQAKKTICEQVKYCTDCRCLWYRARGRVHSCDEIFCKSCKSRHSPNHLCHIRTRASKSTTTTASETQGVSQCKPKKLFVFYDFEATQNTVYRQVGESYEYIHKVDLCVAQSCCDACLHIDDMTYICNFCGPRQRTMSSENPVAELLDFVLREQTDLEQITAICHNSRSYDGQFILRELYDHHIVKGSDKTPEVIANGRKIVRLTFGKVRFIDSLSYLPIKLADLSAAFDLPVQKGYFPHKFNTLENMNHNGKWPEAEDYYPESMSPDGNAKFFAWYETVKSGTFNMREELKTYCTADVTLLRQASLRFREISIEATNVCPFTEAITIAGACAATFRTTFVTDETIGIIPNGGYVRADRQGRKAIEWLLWMEREYPGIKHAINGREHRLFSRIPVDGFLAREGRPDLVLQFHDAEVQDETTTGLFVRYVDAFLKIKQEASGWPKGCDDEESKQAYLDHYLRHEGIALDRNKIAKNAGLCSTAKLALVSLWGKYGQRGNLPKTEIISTPQKLLNLLRHPEKEVGDVMLMNDDAYVPFGSLEGEDSPLKNRKGKLTEKLMNQGLLTQSMLEELQREWIE
ncbi:hypothetical protein QAD02_021330, partial [Eretmocerus hayati]